MQRLADHFKITVPRPQGCRYAWNYLASSLFDDTASARPAKMSRGPALRTAAGRAAGTADKTTDPRRPRQACNGQEAMRCFPLGGAIGSHMNHPVFFEGVVQREVRIGEQAAMVPLFYPRLSMMALTLTVDAAAAQALLPTPAYRLWRLPGGRALASLHCFEYQETGIGPYNEVALTLAVTHGGRRLPLLWRVARAALRDEYHGHVVDLPVTTEAALRGGLEFFNYPKYLADITFLEETRVREEASVREAASVRTCRLSDRASGELILEVRAPRLGGAPAAGELASSNDPQVMVAHSYPVVGGVTQHAQFRIRQLGKRQRILPRDVSVRHGTHPRADLYRRLRLGRPLHYVFVPEGQGILYLPEDLPAAGGRP